jgi:CRP-like cAMP-binding protein
MNPTITYLQSLCPLSPNLIDFLSEKLRSSNLPKKATILKAGQISDRIYFIEEGSVRCFYKKDDKEVHTWFMSKGDVIISVKSFYTQTPSYEYIETLDACTLHYLSYKDLQHIYFTFPEFNFIGRVLTEQYYLKSEERLFAIRNHNSHERYLILKETNPNLIDKIPAKYIASYLGITEETLSRIKRNEID